MVWLFEVIQIISLVFLSEGVHINKKCYNMNFPCRELHKCKMISSTVEVWRAFLHTTSLFVAEEGRFLCRVRYFLSPSCWMSFRRDGLTCGLTLLRPSQRPLCEGRCGFTDAGPCEWWAVTHSASCWCSRAGVSARSLACCPAVSDWGLDCTSPRAGPHPSPRSGPSRWGCG